jgi:hypothetical protein
MSQHTGDKSRHNRNRRKKIARRARMKSLRETLGAAEAKSGKGSKASEA